MTDRESRTEDGGSTRHGCGSHRTRAHRRGRRKERVLHTRVSEQLSEDIRRLAEDLRVPASNLVRNVLEEVFAVVEDVSDDVGEFFEEVVEEAEGIGERIRKQQRAARKARRGRRSRTRARREESGEVTDIEDELRQDEAREGAREAPRGPRPVDDVLGWQPFVLNQRAECARCGNALDPGVNAFLGVRPDGATGPVVCPVCTRIA